MASYLLDHLRQVAEHLLEEEVPVESEARRVLGAVVKRLEAVEVYLSNQASSSSSPAEPKASSPPEPVGVQPAAPEPDATAGTAEPEQPTPEPPAPPTSATAVGGPSTSATSAEPQSEVFTPGQE